jgi:hypothetical protein
LTLIFPGNELPGATPFQRFNASTLQRFNDSLPPSRAVLLRNSLANQDRVIYPYPRTSDLNPGWMPPVRQAMSAFNFQLPRGGGNGGLVSHSA